MSVTAIHKIEILRIILREVRKERERVGSGSLESELVWWRWWLRCWLWYDEQKPTCHCGRPHQLMVQNGGSLFFKVLWEKRRVSNTPSENGYAEEHFTLKNNNSNDNNNNVSNQRMHWNLQAELEQPFRYLASHFNNSWSFVTIFSQTPLNYYYYYNARLTCAPSLSHTRTQTHVALYYQCNNKGSNLKLYIFHFFFKFTINAKSFLH